MIVKADIVDLYKLSERLFVGHPSSSTKRLFGVIIDGSDGYTVVEDDVVNQINFPYTEVTELPIQPENTIEINGARVPVSHLLNTMKYIGVVSRNWGLSADVYVSYDGGKIIGIRFSDWMKFDFWNTMTDEEALEKIQRYLIKKDVFQNTALPLE